MIFRLNNNKIDSRETIPFAPRKRKSVNEIDEIIHNEPKLETAVEIGKPAIIDKEKFIKTELDTNGLILKLLEVEIKKIEDVFDEVKKEESLKDIESFS